MDPEILRKYGDTITSKSLKDHVAFLQRVGAFCENSPHDVEEDFFTEAQDTLLKIQPFILQAATDKPKIKALLQEQFNQINKQIKTILRTILKNRDTDTDFFDKVENLGKLLKNTSIQVARILTMLMPSVINIIEGIL